MGLFTSLIFWNLKNIFFSVYGSRSEENIDPAELPFLEADVREVFESKCCTKLDVFPLHSSFLASFVVFPYRTCFLES